MPSIDLEKFPRPGVTVDLAVLTVIDAGGPDPQLCVLIQSRTDPDGYALPGGFIRERWTVAQTVADVCDRKVGIAVDPAVPIRLLQVFDDPDRDERTWAISIAHAVFLSEHDLAGAHGTLVPVDADGTLPLPEALRFDHGQIVAAAADALRERYEFRYRDTGPSADPDHFLPEPFTLYQLRKVHEAVIGEPLHKDNFNRRMKTVLEPVLRDGRPVLAENLRGRPAALYRRARNHGDDVAR